MKQAIALTLFGQRGLAANKACELAEMSFGVFQELLAAHNVLFL